MSIKLQKSLRRIMEIPPFVPASNDQPQHHAQNHHENGIDARKQVGSNRNQHQQYTGGIGHTAVDQIDGGAENDGHHRRLHSLHGSVYPGIGAESGVKIADDQNHRERRQDHAEHGGEAPGKSAHPVAIEHGHVADHGTGQTLGNAGKVKKLLGRYLLLFFHILLLHLGDDAPAAAEGKAAELRKFQKQLQRISFFIRKITFKEKR